MIVCDCGCGKKGHRLVARCSITLRHPRPVEKSDKCEEHRMYYDLCREGYDKWIKTMENVSMECFGHKGSPDKFGDDQTKWVATTE